jgi:hypothetical protein
VAQVVEHLLSKNEALSSHHNTIKKKGKKLIPNHFSFSQHVFNHLNIFKKKTGWGWSSVGSRVLT